MGRLGRYSTVEDDQNVLDQYNAQFQSNITEEEKQAKLKESAEIEAVLRERKKEAFGEQLEHSNLWKSVWGPVKLQLREMLPGMIAGTTIATTTHLPKIAEWKRASNDDMHKYYPDNKYMPKNHLDYGKVVSPHPESARNKYKWYSRIANNQVAQNLEHHYDTYGDAIKEATTSLGIESWESIKDKSDGWFGMQTTERINWNKKINEYLKGKFSTQFHHEQARGKDTADITDPNFEKKFKKKMKQIKPDYDPFAGSVGAFDKVVMPLLAIYEDDEEKVRRIKEAGKETKEGLSGLVNSAGLWLHKTATESVEAYKDTEDGQLNQAIIDFAMGSDWTWNDVTDVRKSLIKLGTVIPSYGVVGGGQLLVKGVVAGATAINPALGRVADTILTPAVGFLTTFALEGGSAYNDMLNFFDDPSNEPFLKSMYGKDYMLMKNYVAYQTMNDVGIPNAILEFLPIWHLLGKSGASGEIKKKLIRGLIVDNKKAKLITSVGSSSQAKLFGRSIGPKALYSSAWTTARQGLEETVTEILQTANELADFNLSELRFEPNEDISGEMFYNQLAHSGHAGFIGGGGIGGMSSVAIDGTNNAINSYNQYNNIKKGIEIYTTDYATTIGKRGDGWHTIQMKGPDGSLNSFTMNDKGLDATYRFYLDDNDYLAWKFFNTESLKKEYTHFGQDKVTQASIFMDKKGITPRTMADRESAHDLRNLDVWKDMVATLTGKPAEEQSTITQSEAKENGIEDEIVTDKSITEWKPREKAIALATNDEDETQVGTAVRFILDQFEYLDTRKQGGEPSGIFGPTPKDKQSSPLFAPGLSAEERWIKAIEILQDNNIILNDILDTTKRFGTNQRTELKQILMRAIREAELFSRSKDTRLDSNIEYVAESILQGKAKIKQKEVTIKGQTSLKPVLDFLGLEGDLKGDIDLNIISKEFASEITDQQVQYEKDLLEEEKANELIVKKDILSDESKEMGSEIERSELKDDLLEAIPKEQFLKLVSYLKSVPNGRVILDGLLGKVLVKNDKTRTTLLRQGVKLANEGNDKKLSAWLEKAKDLLIEDRVDTGRESDKIKKKQSKDNEKTAPQNKQNNLEEGTPDPTTDEDDDWFNETSDDDVKDIAKEEIQEKQIKFGSRKWKELVYGIVGSVFEKAIKEGKTTFEKKLAEFKKLSKKRQIDLVYKHTIQKDKSGKPTIKIVDKLGTQPKTKKKTGTNIIDQLLKPAEEDNKPIVTKSGISILRNYISSFDISSMDLFKTFKNLFKKDGKPTFGWLAVWYGPVKYTYSNISHKAKEMPEELQSMARLIEKKLGVPEGYFNSALANVFPKGKGIGAHADDEAIFVRENGTIGKVATISFGGSTGITITDKETGAIIETITVNEGDLYLMPGQNFQLENKHQVGKASKERVSITFRHIPQNILPEDTQKISELQEQEETTTEDSNENRTQDEIDTPTIGTSFDDLMGKIKGVGSAVGDVVKTLTPKHTYLPEELAFMGQAQLIEIAHKLGIKGVNKRWGNETLVKKILDAQGPIYTHGGLGFSGFTPEQYAEFKVSMDALWKQSKATGTAFMAFVRAIQSDFIKKYGQKSYVENIAGMLKKWVDDIASVDVSGVAKSLGFKISEYNNKEYRDDKKVAFNEFLQRATGHEVIEDGMSTGMDVYDGDNGFLLNKDTNHFSAWHNHTLTKKRFLKMFGGLIDEKLFQFYQNIARRYDNSSSFRLLEEIGLQDKNLKSLRELSTEFDIDIDWIEEGAMLDQDRFIRDMYDHMNFNGMMEENEANTNFLKLFWLSNQVENMMPMKEVNKSIIDTTSGSPVIKTRPDRLHNVVDPEGTMPDFINHEEAELELLYSALGAGDIVKSIKSKDGSVYWVDGRAQITPEWLLGEHIRLGKLKGRQFSIIGVKSTTNNPQIIIAEVTALDFTRADNFEQYMREELEAGNLLPIDVANYTRWFNAMEQAPSESDEKAFKRVQLAQELAVHRTMQLMRYNKYATQMYSHNNKVPSISNIFKRLKGDATKGMVPVGLGDIKVMQIDVQNIVLENSETGESIDPLFEGNSLWDGQLLTSNDVISRIGNIIGDPKLSEIKPYIRHRSEDGENYINIKSEASVPGSFIIREKNADGSIGPIIAEVKTVYTEEGIWEARIVDSIGNPIDFLGTQEEIKNALGQYDKLNNIINLPESALRIISTDKHVNYEAPFPTIWLDSLASPQDEQVRQILTDYIVEATINSYVHDTDGHGMFQVFGDIRNTNLLRKVILGLEAEDSMPQQLGLYMRYLTGGHGHSVFTDELKFVIKNRILVDKVFRGSLAFGGTNSTLSGDHSREVGLDEFHIGAKNSWAFDVAINAYRKAKGLDKLEGIKGKVPVSLSELNDWLAEGHLSVLAFRHPLNGKTEVRMKKLTKLLPPNRGNIIVQNPEDTFKINVADHDGDHGMLVALPNDISEILETYMNREGEYSKSHRTTDLDIFLQHGVELDEEGNPILARISNIQQRLTSISAVAEFYKTIGAIINFKRIRGILAIKGIDKFILAKMGKGGAQSEIELIKPDDKVIMSYAKLDKTQRDKIDPKDRILQNDNGDLFLETTSEQEMTLLANASTDNPDRMLLMDWGYEGKKWLIKRIFRRTDGKELTKHQVTSLLYLVDKFNYSRKLKGKDRFGGQQELHQIMGTSTTINNSLKGTPEEQTNRLSASINNAIMKRKTKQQAKWYFKGLTLNGEQIATERLLASIKDKHDEYYKNNPQPRGANNKRTWVQLNPALEAMANHNSAEVLQSKVSEYAKKYNISDADATAGLAFLLKFVNGDKKWMSKDGKYVYKKFKKDENGNDLLDAKGNRVPDKAGFFHIFDLLDSDRENLKEVNKSGISLSGYSYQDGMDQLFEDFIEEWEGLSEGAQASFIYGWFTGAKVRNIKVGNKTLKSALRKPSNLAKMLPFQFNVVSTYDVDGNLRIDATILNDFFNAFEENSKHLSLKKDWRHKLDKIKNATFTSITEVTCNI